VLVVDDEAEFLCVLLRRVRDLGYEVDGALSATEAQRLTIEHRYDVALIDLRMSVNGIELMARIAQQSEPPQRARKRQMNALSEPSRDTSSRAHLALFDHGFELSTMPHDARVFQQALDVTGREPGDASESRQRRAETSVAWRGLCAN
jgi:CheY-like chemotaxis protein